MQGERTEVVEGMRRHQPRGHNLRLCPQIDPLAACIRPGIRLDVLFTHIVSPPFNNVCSLILSMMIFSIILIM